MSMPSDPLIGQVDSIGRGVRTIESLRTVLTESFFHKLHAEYSPRPTQVIKYIYIYILLIFIIPNRYI